VTFVIFAVLQVLADRLSSLEAIVPTVQMLQERVTQTSEEFEARLKTYQQSSQQQHVALAVAQQVRGSNVTKMHDGVEIIQR